MPHDLKDTGKLHDMIAYAQEAIDLLGARSVHQMVEDRRTFLAVSRCVEIIGEAGWSLSDAVKRAHTRIPWPLIAGMRHRLVHDYGRVDAEIIHAVITEHLPPLIVALREMLNDNLPSAPGTSPLGQPEA